MDHYTAQVLRLSRGNGHSMLNRMRNLARRDVVPLVEAQKVPGETEFLDALSVLDDAAATSALGRGRRFEMEPPRWMGRICLEHNLEQIRQSAEMRMDEETGSAEKDDNNRRDWEQTLRSHEKRKMKKAEAALRRLLKIQEC